MRIAALSWSALKRSDEKRNKIELKKKQADDTAT